MVVCYVYDRTRVQWRVILHSDPQDCTVSHLRIASCWIVPEHGYPAAKQQRAPEQAQASLKLI